MRLVARPICILCGSAGTRLYDGMRDNLFAAPGLWALTKCQNAGCSLLWLDPAPHPDDLPLLYKGYYTHGDDEERGFLLKVAGGMYRLISTCLLAPLGVPLERRRARRMFIERKSPGTLLDIGCGNGAFLSVMAGRGWRVAGLDFDEEAVAYARNQRKLDVEVGTAASHAASGRKYDLVTASHVIEHVPEPTGFLRQCGQLLRPGGRIILRTPNAESLGHRLYGQAWRGLEPPRHLQLFTFAALAACARNAGLKVESEFTSVAEAEAILIMSHFLLRKGSFRFEEFSHWDLLEWVLFAPLLCARAKIAWWLDKGCGEELYVILANENS
jgi:2-polyprenyl-3-methyl-5-hydroxy-6-metoxy-1,4-benzoquinol methylase